MPNQTWIYLIKDNFTGFHKIGFSNDPQKRVKDLRKQKTLLPMPNDFELVEAWLATTEHEKHLHDHFKDFRKRGEWFDISGEEIDWLYEEFFYFHKTLKYGASLFDHRLDGGATPMLAMKIIDLSQEVIVSNTEMLDFAVEGFGCEL